MSGGYVPTLSTVARWFTARRSLMSGIVLIGLSIGNLLAAPVSNSLIESYGWRQSYLILGALILFFSVVAAQFLKREPSTMGLQPYGEHRIDNKSQAASGLTLGEAIITRQFWTVIAMEFIFGFLLITLFVHLVPHITDLKIPMSTAAAIMAVSGAGSILGRVTLGPAGDRLGNRAVYMIGFILLSAGLVWLVFIRDTISLFFYAGVFGWAYGGIESSESPIVAWLFGIKHHGLIFGSLTLAFTIGAAVGPFLAGYIFDSLRSYQTDFILMAILGIIGFILTASLKPFLKK